MSGGTYDYVYFKIEDLAAKINVTDPGCPDYVDVQLRQKFKELLYAVAKAARAVEWNDSGDGDSEEKELIKNCFSNCDHWN